MRVRVSWTEARTMVSYLEAGHPTEREPAMTTTAPIYVCPAQGVDNARCLTLAHSTTCDYCGNGLDHPDNDQYTRVDSDELVVGDRFRMPADPARPHSWRTVEAVHGELVTVSYTDGTSDLQFHRSFWGPVVVLDWPQGRSR